MNRILIVRTLQADLLAGVLAKWRKVYPAASFSILTHADTQNLEYYSQEFDSIFFYKPKHDFSLFYISPSLVRRIRKGNFELVIFPKKMRRLTGFENVLLMLPVFGIRKWAHCGIDGELFSIEKNYVGKIVVAGLGSLIIAPVFYGFLVAVLSVMVLYQKLKKQAA